MNDRFLIPSAVALTMHTMLFFGFNRGPVPVSRDPDVKPDAPPPVEAIQLDWPPDSEPGASAEPLGKPDAARSELPELPPQVALTEITIPREPPAIAPVNSSSRIATEPFGNPKGFVGIVPGGPLSPSQLDNPPRTRTQLAPVYPYEARKDGRPGEVMVEFVVDESGRVLDPHVLRSNDSLFDAPTLRAVAKWRFEPGRKNGRVVRFRMAVPVTYAVNP